MARGGSGGPPSGSAGSGGSSRGGGASVSAETIAYLEAQPGLGQVPRRVDGSQTSASIIIATGKPVVTIGGFADVRVKASRRGRVTGSLYKVTA